MSNKFTEGQYQKIVELHDKRDFSVDGTLDVITYFVYNISRTGDADIDTALAIANPLTREWAHDKFVEKEKKYRWSSKAQDEDGYVKRLYKEESGMISGYSADRNDVGDYFGDKLTESEIKAWGYNPEMFDREEVQ